MAGAPDDDDDEGADEEEDPPSCLAGFASFMVSFVTTNYAASVTLATEAGIPQDWILAWSADESSFGTSSIAKKSGNYFGWHGPGNIKCPTGTNTKTGCFSSFLASGTTALFSEHTWFNYNGNPHSSAGQILLNQYQNNASAATAFQALSKAGYNSNPNYGAQVAGSYFLGNVDGIENCLSSLGQLH